MFRTLFVAGLSAMLVATAAQADVTVIRGNAQEVVKTGGSGITELRGSALSLDETHKPRKSVSADRQWYVSSGDTLWFTRADGKAVAGCFLVSSGTVGKYNVRCSQVRTAR